MCEPLRDHRHAFATPMRVILDVLLLEFRSSFLELVTEFSQERVLSIGGRCDVLKNLE